MNKKIKQLKKFCQAYGNLILAETQSYENQTEKELLVEKAEKKYKKSAFKVAKKLLKRDPTEEEVASLIDRDFAALL